MWPSTALDAADELSGAECGKIINNTTPHSTFGPDCRRLERRAALKVIHLPRGL